jgi:hypothetical protein
MQIWPLSNLMLDERESGPHIVVVCCNSITQGFMFFGPFDGAREALNWLGTALDNGWTDGWVVPLETPASYK